MFSFLPFLDDMEMCDMTCLVFSVYTMKNPIILSAYSTEIHLRMSLFLGFNFEHFYRSYLTILYCTISDCGVYVFKMINMKFADAAIFHYFAKRKKGN